MVKSGTCQAVKTNPAELVLYATHFNATNVLTRANDQNG